MINYEQAIELIYKTDRLKTKRIAFEQARGFIAAQSIKARNCVPPFSNSAMDGFAIYDKDIAHATEKKPVFLPISGNSAAGDILEKGIPNTCWEIMTGAGIPKGYNTVVKLEDVCIEQNQIKFHSPVPACHHIRKAGEDFSIGDEIIHPGTLISPHHIMALAAIGEKNILVYHKPALTFFITGKELIDNPETSLESGQIRNSNGPYLHSALNEIGINPHYGGLIKDDPEAFEIELKNTLSHSDILITTGAVSAGKYDFIPHSLKRLGADIIFHKLAIRPGKPLLYARFKNGKHFFGLPGNPVSAIIGLRFFVIPLIRHLQNMPIEKPITIEDDSLSLPEKKGVCFFQKAYLSLDTTQKFRLHILDGQESFKIHPMLKANSWAVFSRQIRDQTHNPKIKLYPLFPEKWSLSMHA